MQEKLTRRDFLTAAGGITLLSLTPLGDGLFTTPARADDKPIAGQGPRPIFTALPYIQPGPSSALADGQEAVVIAWQTDTRPASFTVDYGSDKSYGTSAAITTGQRSLGKAEDSEDRINYSAALSGLSLGRRYEYRVKCDGQTIAEGYLTTRKPRGQKTRFVAFGDNCYGDISDRAIAYYTYKANPDFVMNTGDNVYDKGLDNEYSRYFFSTYNSDVADARVGAPLLRSVPFYTVIANHDVAEKDDNHHPIADFSKDADSLGYYTAMHLPLNGPAQPAQPTPITGPDKLLSQFQDCAGDRFPRMANYSFDYADIHFLCLDSNVYIDPTDSALQAWVKSDLAATNAAWKFVIYHHPAYNVGQEHYASQHMRVLSPIFEQAGVDFVLSGHEHNYQRTRPLLFAPTDSSQAGTLGESDRLVPGTFTVDTNFDGVKNTKPAGVFYITTGAGGKRLYDAPMNEAPETWVLSVDKNVPYVGQMITDRHSFSQFDVSATELTMTQIDEWGNEIDRIRVTKSA